MKSVCLAILNYNGIRHLEHLLPTLRPALDAYGGPCTAVVLDNQSTQGDAEWMRANHGDVEVVSAPSNDCLFSYNRLLSQLNEDIVVLLNNDLRLSPDFLAPLVQHFERDDVFAVSATSEDWEGSQRTCGPASLTAVRGWYRWDYQLERQELCHTLFASGGFSAVDRDKFNQLGGFNRLFYPAYCEDLDLCFRAWRRGWRSVFEPASVVFHREGASWQADRRRERLAFLSQLLFTWTTLPPARDPLRRYAMYAWVLLLNCRHGRYWCLTTWLEAMRRWMRVRGQYAWMRITPGELAEIQRRIAQPVVAGNVRRSAPPVPRQSTVCSQPASIAPPRDA